MMNGYLQLFFNVILLLFWARLWTPRSGAFYFNPFLARATLLTDRVYTFFAPALRLSEPAMTLLILLVVWAFKALMVGRLGGEWQVLVGSAFIFSAPVIAEAWWPHFLFSGLHFFLFIVRLWAVYYVVMLITPVFRSSRALEVFAFLARPFSGLPRWLQPIVLVLAHFVIVSLIARAGELKTLSILSLEIQEIAVGKSPFLVGTEWSQAMHLVALAVLSVLDGLSFLTSSLVFVIVCQLVSVIIGFNVLALICQETCDMLLGRFSKGKRLVTGVLDFTPLIFFFVVQFIYGNLSQIVYKLIMR